MPIYWRPNGEALPHKSSQDGLGKHFKYEAFDWTCFEGQMF